MKGPVCIYFPGDPECMEEGVNFFRNKQGLIRPICLRCGRDVFSQYADSNSPPQPITDEVLDELACQEVMLS